MFERFTNEARRALVVAQEVARARGDRVIDTGHVLAGVADCGDELVERILGGVGLDRASITAQLGEAQGDAHDDTIPFTDAAKRGLEMSLREALRAASKRIEPAFLLLGLMHVEGSGGAVLVEQAGLDLDGVRAEVEDQLDRTDSAGRRSRRARRAGRGGIDVEELLLLGMPSTRGARTVLRRVRRHVVRTGEPATTVDMVLAVLEAGDSLGAKALIQLGVTTEALAAAAAGIGPEGTSDEVVRSRPPAPITVDLGGVEVRITDPTTIDRLRTAAAGGAAGADLAQLAREELRRQLGE